MTEHCWLQITGGVNPRSLAAQAPGRGIKRVIVKGCGFILCAPKALLVWEHRIRLHVTDTHVGKSLGEQIPENLLRVHRLELLLYIQSMIQPFIHFILFEAGLRTDVAPAFFLRFTSSSRIEPRMVWDNLDLVSFSSFDYSTKLPQYTYMCTYVH